MKHTQGKWEAVQDGTTTNDEGDTVGIFRVMGSDNLVCESCYEADARLIAAAPELFATLESILNGVKDGDVPMPSYVVARNLLASIEGDA